LAELQRLIAPLEQWTEKEQTQAEFVYRHIWQQRVNGTFAASPPQ